MITRSKALHQEATFFTFQPAKREPLKKKAFIVLKKKFKEDTKRFLITKESKFCLSELVLEADAKYEVNGREMDYSTDEEQCERAQALLRREAALAVEFVLEADPLVLVENLRK